MQTGSDIIKIQNLAQPICLGLAKKRYQTSEMLWIPFVRGMLFEFTNHPVFA